MERDLYQQVVALLWALPVTELGPGTMLAMCREGATAATNSTTLAAGLERELRQQFSLAIFAEP